MFRIYAKERSRVSSDEIFYNLESSTSFGLEWTDSSGMKHRRDDKSRFDKDLVAEYLIQLMDGKLKWPDFKAPDGK